MLMINLNEKVSEKVNIMSRLTGRTPEEVVNDTLWDNLRNIEDVSDAEECHFKANGIFTPTGKGMGKKGKSQVKKTMNKYGCQRGVIVSPTTSMIEKDDDVIFLPLTTFSMM